MGQPLADGLAHPRRALRDLAVLPLGGRAASRKGKEPLISRGDAAEPPVGRRTDDVLLPVPRAGAGSSSSSRSILSVALGLSAVATGVRLLPLSITLLAAAIGIPRLFPHVSPRLVVRAGLLALLAGTVVLLAAFDVDAGPEIVFVPLLLIGLGIGALASQLGAVIVSAVPDEQSSEVGGLQNTMTNLGASFGTALAGSLLIASMSSSFLANIQQNPAISPAVEAAGAGRARRRGAVRVGRRPRSRARGATRRSRDRRTRHSPRTRTPASTGSVRRSRSSPCWRSWRCS